MRAIGSWCPLIVPFSIACIWAARCVAVDARQLAEDTHYTLRLEEIRQCVQIREKEVAGRGCTGPYRMVFSITSKRDGKTGTALVDEQAFEGSPHETITGTIVGDRALIVGNDRAGEIIVFDLTSPFAARKVIDCVRPALSTDKTKVAYVDLQTRIAERTDVVSVLDVKSEQLTSYAVYPSVSERKGSNTGEHVVLSPLSWGRFDQKLVFLERIDRRDPAYLVELDLRQGLGKPTILRDVLNLAELIDPIAKQMGAVPSPIFFQVESMRWDGDDRIEILFEDAGYWKFRMVKWRIPSAMAALRAGEKTGVTKATPLGQRTR